MAESRIRWDPGRRDEAYRELEHPSDLFLEIRGRDLADLFENALFAFYQQVAQLEEFEARRELTLCVREPGLDLALRSLLAEALYQYDTSGFVAVDADVRVETPGTASAGEWRLTAKVWGENADRRQHELLHEIKAVTYHRLDVGESDGGWRATVLLDI